jgi:hypothetical protein
MGLASGNSSSTAANHAGDTIWAVTLAVANRTGITPVDAEYQNHRQHKRCHPNYHLNAIHALNLCISRA